MHILETKKTKKRLKEEENKGEKFDISLTAISVLSVICIRFVLVFWELRLRRMRGRRRNDWRRKKRVER